ncbi:hypothetical protein [Micromonospora sp. NPDC126480]|uniref:hypothetical protein n=1 Tax=Micromonospora sp. NPDC126480 TaxID=3155312 RepID=UPI00332C441E
MSRHRVLLVRPWDTARAGSGCCTGATEICAEGWHEDPAVARRRAGQRPLGEVYLAVRAGLPPEVEVEIVDPHNTLFLLPAMLRDGRRHRRPWRALLRDLARAPGYAAIIVNGRVLSDAGLPAPEQALRLIRQALDAPPREAGLG